MKKYINLNVTLIISFIIIVGFISSTLITTKGYTKIIEDDIANISKLSSTNIYSEINNELTKPVFVSLTMANDSFLKNWLVEENVKDKVNTQKLQNYLNGIKTKYNYNSVFLVSEKTKNYYHYDGILKTISKSNTHDQWFYNFLAKNVTYELDVDNDEAKKNTLTVFINCRIVDSNNNLLGVVGVGVEMHEVQAILRKFESNYKLEAFLIDENGLIQVHTNNAKIEHDNIFNSFLKNQKENIINNRSTMFTYKYKLNKQNNFLISRYVDEMGWYLIIKKDTSILKRSFSQQIMKDIIIIIIIVSLLLFIIRLLIKYYRNFITMLGKVDELTKLPNRKVFNEQLTAAMKDNIQSDHSFYVFIFDVDHFKKLNDIHGHLFGDTVLLKIAECSKGLIATEGLVARWGGDEFSGILYTSEDKAKNIVLKLIYDIANINLDFNINVTISLGLTKFENTDSFDTLLSRADEALYKAKLLGRNQMYML